MKDLSVNDLIKQLRTKSKSGTRDSKTAATALKKTGKLAITQAVGIEIKCPVCGSVSYVKNGLDRFKCKDCGKSFRADSGTLLSGYDFTQDEWLDIIGCIIDRQNNGTFSARVKYPMSRQKAWKLRLKILSAFMNMPQPVLAGIVQVDGTYFRESQKSSSDLKSYVFKNQKRAARIEYTPSVSGIFGPEFICCIAGIDSHDHVFAKCISIGTPTYDELKKVLDEQIKTPSYLCSDSHSLYEQYCDEYSYVHHITPSTYSRDFIMSGGIIQNDKYHPASLSTDENKSNERIRKKLYEDRCAPHLRNSGKMSYEVYKTIIKNQGEKYFDIQRINEFHGDLKERLVNTSKNVSSRLLQAYIALEVYIRNFTVDYGHKPGEKLGDYEIIFNDVLKYYRYEDYKKLLDNDITPLTFNERANKVAHRKIVEARNAIRTDKKTFENKEDAEMPVIFRRRECFRSMPRHRIDFLCKYFNLNVEGLNRTKKAEELAKLNNADEIIFREIQLMYYATDEEIIEARLNGYLAQPKRKQGRPRKYEKLINTIYTNQQLKEMKDLKKIVIDTETTGLYKEREDEILSLAIIDGNGNILLDKLFKPEDIQSWDEAEKLNHISPNDVKACLLIKDYLPLIQTIFDGAEMIIGFNLDFDLLALKQAGIEINDQILFDVMKTHTQLKGYKKNHNLDRVAKYYDYQWPINSRHTALGDTKATLYCFNEIINR